MRTGWYRPVHVKSVESQEWRLLLGHRRLVVNKLVDVEAEIRGTLRGFGLKLGKVARGRFAARVLGSCSSPVRMRGTGGYSRRA